MTASRRSYSMRIFYFSLFISFALVSCSSQRSIHSGHVDQGFTHDYIDPESRILVEYSTRYWLQTKRATKDFQTNRLLNRVVVYSGDSAVTLVTGKCDIYPQYKTALIRYKTEDHSNFTREIANEVRKRFSPDLLEVHVASDSGVLDGVNYLNFPSLKGKHLNRLFYEKKKRNKHWVISEYHLKKDDYVLRFIWWVDKEHGFGDEIEDQFQIPSFQSQAQYTLASIQDAPGTSEIDPFIVAGEVFLKNRNILLPYYTLTSSSKFAQHNDFSSKSLYLQALMTFQSFVGDHRAALKSADRLFGQRDTVQDNVALQALRPDSAAKILLSQAKDHRVIMFNEAHHVPVHRAFIRDLLPRLYEIGYKFLAVETLSYEDSLINDRKFPIQESGFYSMEPVFGQLLRNALALGFKVFPYEDTVSCIPPPNADPNYCNNQRELQQAKNINRILNSNGDAKVVVVGGYDHVHERSIGTWKHMAQNFKEISGTDPITVDQVEMTERSEPHFENAFYKYLVSQFDLNVPTIFSKEDSVWIRPERRGVIDYQVVHPRIKYHEGIPDWILPKVSDNKPARIRIPPGSPIRLLEVFLENELEEDYPIAVYNKLLTDKRQNVKLSLPTGRYIWRIQDIYKTTEAGRRFIVK